MSTRKSLRATARAVTSPITAMRVRESMLLAVPSPRRRKRFRNAEGDAKVQTSGGRDTISPATASSFSARPFR
jgi:hypothetical protein